jgi:hypothetical protein
VPPFRTRLGDHTADEGMDWAHKPKVCDRNGHWLTEDFHENPRLKQAFASGCG